MQQILRESLGIAVVQADPFDAPDLRQAVQQRGNHPLAVQVQSVVGSVLGHDYQLLDSGGSQ